MSNLRHFILLLATAIIILHHIALGQHSNSEEMEGHRKECETFVPKKIEKDTIIHFCSGNIDISEPIVLSNLTNITFVGKNNTTLRCNGIETGLKFVHVIGLTITSLKIVGCGSVHDSTTEEKYMNSTVKLSSALYIINCTDLFFNGLHVVNSSGVGLVMYDVSGVVEILNSVFEHNSQQNTKFDDIFRGGGLYIEFTVCTAGVYCTHFNSKPENMRANGNHYLLDNCTFANNKAQFWGSKYMQYDRDKNNSRLNHQGLGRGGGLSIQLSGKSDFNTFTIRDCTFRANEANWGGGLYIVIQDYSSHNIINLLNLTIQDNVCKHFGGGGVDLGYNTALISNNTVRFDYCTFERNRAVYGGGIRFFSNRREQSDLLNVLEFYHCNWTQNEAKYGSAIDIAPHVWEILSRGFLPVPVFHNCEFRSNAVTVENSYTGYENGRGSMMLTDFNAIFSGFIIFEGNSGSALYLSSSIITTRPETICEFVGNDGFEGGAIAFVGLSALFVMENNSFTFNENTALRRGGAIYEYNIDKHNFVSSRSCFIQYHGSIDSKNSNVTFVFKDNYAKIAEGNQTECYAAGHDIFSPSLQTCIVACNHPTEGNERVTHHYAHSDTFTCVGTFIFHGADIKCHLSTSGGKFQINETMFLGENQYFQLYPGREANLPISVINYYYQTIDAVYYATLSQNVSSVTFGQPYTYISNRKVRLNGQPGTDSVLRLQKLGYRELRLNINISLLECPPGYILDDTEKCVCSASNSNTSFLPILQCDYKLFQGHLQKGYWFGFNKNTHKFEYGYCPGGYCNYDHFDQNSVLPKTKEMLDKDVCGIYRTGRLCGECRENYSVHYHGINHQCRDNKSCDYGWLLYIVSELFPLTVLFVLATVLNISLTSGTVNGFIFFSQVIDSIPVTGNSFIIFPNPVYHMYTITRMIYNVFNFEFFIHDKLSFCLWRGATTMDMLIFKFITVVYVLLLVIVTVGLINYCNILQKCSCFRYSTIKSSIIHGLSAVLVIVFSQCFKVCCQILSITYIYGQGNILNETVVFLQGNMTPFSGDHLKYAIFAILCMLIMFIPMLLLLIYPFCFKLLSIFKCVDTNPIAKMFIHAPYSKLKPFLDSFQSCFKDDYRVFAGLYFVYRVLIICTTLFPKLSHQYLTLDVFLVSFLLIHSIAQPYLKRWHNILDSLLLLCLIIINQLTRFNYDNSKFPIGDSQIGDSQLLPYSTTLLVIIMNCPIVYLIAYILVRLVCKVRGAVKKTTQLDLVQLQDWDDINRDRESDSNSDENSDYHPFEK